MGALAPEFCDGGFTALPGWLLAAVMVLTEEAMKGESDKE